MKPQWTVMSLVTPLLTVGTPPRSVNPHCRATYCGGSCFSPEDPGLVSAVCPGWSKPSAVCRSQPRCCSQDWCFAEVQDQQSVLRMRKPKIKRFKSHEQVWAWTACSYYAYKMCGEVRTPSFVIFRGSALSLVLLTCKQTDEVFQTDCKTTVTIWMQNLNESLT